MQAEGAGGCQTPKPGSQSRTKRGGCLTIKLSCSEHCCWGGKHKRKTHRRKEQPPRRVRGTAGGLKARAPEARVLLPADFLRATSVVTLHAAGLLEVDTALLRGCPHPLRGSGRPLTHGPLVSSQPTPQTARDEHLLPAVPIKWPLPSSCPGPSRWSEASIATRGLLPGPDAYPARPPAAWWARCWASPHCSEHRVVAVPQQGQGASADRTP